SDQECNAVPDGGHHLGQNAQSRRHAVELAAAVIGHHQGICSDVHCATGILCRMDTFYYDRAVPCLMNPFEIVPSHDGLLESSSDIGIKHWTFPRDDDILKLH